MTLLQSSLATPKPTKKFSKRYSSKELQNATSQISSADELSAFLSAGIDEEDNSITVAMEEKVSCADLKFTVLIAKLTKTFTLTLLSVETSKVDRLEMMVLDLAAQVRELKLEKAKGPVVLSLGAGAGFNSEGKMLWQKERIPIDTQYFELTNNCTITVKQPGTYLIHHQVLNASGKALYTSCSINGEKLFYSYASGSAYQSVNGQFVVKLEANSLVEIAKYGGEIYSSISGLHGQLTILRCQ